MQPTIVFSEGLPAFFGRQGACHQESPCAINLCFECFQKVKCFMVEDSIIERIRYRIGPRPACFESSIVLHGFSYNVRAL